MKERPMKKLTLVGDVLHAFTASMVFDAKDTSKIVKILEKMISKNRIFKIVVSAECKPNLSPSNTIPVRRT